MKTLSLFTLEVVVAASGYAAVAFFLIVPALDRLERSRQLMLLLLPQMLRHVGAVFIVPGMVGAGYPADLGRDIAYGDLATSAGAVAAIIALGLQMPGALVLTWVVNLFGTVDLLASVVRSSLADVSGELHAAWYVTALLVPLSAVSHVLIFRALLRRQPLHTDRPA